MEAKVMELCLNILILDKSSSMVKWKYQDPKLCLMRPYPRGKGQNMLAWAQQISNCCQDWASWYSAGISLSPVKKLWSTTHAMMIRSTFSGIKLMCLWNSLHLCTNAFSEILLPISLSVRQSNWYCSLNSPPIQSHFFPFPSSCLLYPF